MTDLRKMSNEELLDEYVGNVASGIQVDSDSLEGEINALRAELLRRLAPSEGMEPESEINWQGLYQRTEDALLALRVELGGQDYKTHAIDHVATISYLLKKGAALSPARSGEPSAPQTRAEQYIGSDQERVFLEKKALGDLAAPQPVSGDAPKVEEVPLARKAAYALAYADAVAVDEMEAILRPYFPPASQTPKFGIYIASKTKHAQKWKDLRAAGEPIISTWIDESGIGETKSFEDLWERCIDEAASAERLVVYAEEGDELKGALVEVGAALASGTPVWIVGTVEALKTARNHRLMRKAASIKEAFSGVHTVATPASTARTDALLNLLRAADDVLAEQSLINQRFTQKQDALFAELMGWRDANGTLAAPGSVPPSGAAERGRMKLTKQQREHLRLKFGGMCAYCGCELPEKGWHVDHVEPVMRDWEFVRDALGNLQTKNGVTVTRQTGKMFRPENDTRENLFPACAPCNIDKGTCLLEDWRTYLHQRIVIGLRANSSTFRHAERFGVVSLSTAPLVFWFEKFGAAQPGDDKPEGAE